MTEDERTNADPHDEETISLEGEIVEHAEAMAAPQGLFCTSCGTSLLNVNVEDLCPSCGSPVANSFRFGAAMTQGPTSGLAVASLVLGILSIVSCMLYGLPSIVFGPAAIITGKMAQKRIRAGVAGGSSGGLATSGFTMGIIGTVLGVLGVAVIGLGFLLPLLLRIP